MYNNIQNRHNNVKPVGLFELIDESNYKKSKKGFNLLNRNNSFHTSFFKNIKNDHFNYFNTFMKELYNFSNLTLEMNHFNKIFFYKLLFFSCKVEETIKHFISIGILKNNKIYLRYEKNIKYFNKLYKTKYYWGLYKDEFLKELKVNSYITCIKKNKFVLIYNYEKKIKTRQCYVFNPEQHILILPYIVKPLKRNKSCNIYPENLFYF